MLLDVVAFCCAKFETGHTFNPVQTDVTLLANNSQLGSCCVRLHVALVSAALSKRLARLAALGTVKMVENVV